MQTSSSTWVQAVAGLGVQEVLVTGTQTGVTASEHEVTGSGRQTSVFTEAHTVLGAEAAAT